MRLTAEQAAIVREILERHLPGREVRVFGSRLGPEGHAYSDLDLLILGAEPVPLEVLGGLHEAFEESPLPFVVDLLDAQRVSPAFRARALAQSELLAPAASKPQQPLR